MNHGSGNDYLTARESVNNYRLIPYARYTPINRTYFDFFVQVGPQIGIYNQESPRTTYDFDTQQNILIDDGDKGVNVGYDLGTRYKCTSRTVYSFPVHSGRI